MNNEEFLVMLAACGRRSWYGIGLPAAPENGAAYGIAGLAAEDGGDEAVNAVLSSLYRKELIDWGRENARIADDVRPVFRVLRDTGTCILYASDARPEPVTGAYCHDGRVVLAEQSMTREREIKLTLLSAEDWIEQLIRDGYLPETIQMPEDPDDAEDPDSGTGLPGGLQDCRGAEPEMADLLAGPGVRAVFERRLVPSGKLKERLILRDMGLYASADLIRADASESGVIGPDGFRSVMTEWTGGGRQ